MDGVIDVDMTSLAGRAPVQITADQLIAGFKTGLHAGKVSHHLATNYRIQVKGDRADLWATGMPGIGSRRCPPERTCGRPGGTTASASGA